jgi:hypothetical protein
MKPENFCPGAEVRLPTYFVRWRSELFDGTCGPGGHTTWRDGEHTARQEVHLIESVK